MVKARDEELRRMFDKVVVAKERARAKRLELEEQLAFLENERENVRELEGNIKELERSAARLQQGGHAHSCQKLFHLAAQLTKKSAIPN